jgi:hypothetical protein
MVHAPAAMPASSEQFTPFHAAISIGAGRPEIPTNDRQNNVLRTRQHAHALNYGDAMH